MSPSPARVIGVVVGAIVILGIGVYGPATLLGPLPAVAVTPAGSPASVETSALPLPETGQTAVALVGDDGDGEVIQATPDAEPQAIGAVAKLVLLLTVLDGQPLPADGPGPELTVTAQDYTDYFDLQQAGARVVDVQPGETWSERDVVRAILLGSSNNHATMLARWAYGTVDGYLTAASLWLADHGFTTISVADPTGLSEDNVGTAAEVARLGALVAGNPALLELLQRGETITVGEHRIADIVNHLPEAGIRTMSRSYTDTGWLSFVFTTTLPTGDGSPERRAVAASLGMPDYETLDPAMTALADAMRASAAPVTVIPQGGVFATATAQWGAHAQLVATRAASIPAFASAPGEPKIAVESFSTGRTGEQLGTVTVPLESGELESPLELDAPIREPGVFWRLTHPIPLIAGLFADAG